MSIGVPVKLLHEAIGHIVTVELKSGDVYRGKMHEAEDNMNIQLTGVTVTRRDGRVSQLEQIFVRGSHCRWFILPDILSNAPMFKKIGTAVPRSTGLGVGSLGAKRGRGNFPRSQHGGARGRGMHIRR